MGLESQGVPEGTVCPRTSQSHRGWWSRLGTAQSVRLRGHDASPKGKAVFFKLSISEGTFFYLCTPSGTFFYVVFRADNEKVSVF